MHAHVQHFYKKAVSTKQVQHVRIALSRSSKSAILTSEMLMRMTNSHQKVRWSEVRKLLVKYTMRMKEAGQQMVFRKETTGKALAKYPRLKDLQESRTRGVNSNSKEM